MGARTRTIIRPAIDALQAEGIDAFGPLPADTHVPRPRPRRL